MGRKTPYLVADRYELIEELGIGSMGVVWHARHAKRDEPVALKFIHDEAAKHDAIQRRFHREVRAQASLRHPSILQLYDYGIVSPEDAAHIGSQITTDSPYLSMEFAPNGSLREWGRFDRWATLRDVIFQILDALATAHARSVIHRDLKPKNLLRFPAPDSEGAAGRVKLADFGLAHALDRDRERPEDQSLSRPSAGTPLYMAPEQLNGHWRRFGPWTDLYQLGCIVWEAVCGQPPFQGSYYLAVAAKHISEPPPDLEPEFPVPYQLQDWVHTLMAKSPEDRFRRAADAAASLRELADATTQPETSPDPTGETVDETVADTWDAPGGLPNLVLGETESDEPPVDAAPHADETGHFPAPRPSLPPSWRRSDPNDDSPHSEAIRLWGLQDVPFVGREAERDTLWSTVRTTVRDRTLQCVVIEGRAGTGKSRLVRWIARRAHELGAVHVLKADHPRQSAPDRGLRELVERHFQTWDLDRADCYEHLRSALERLPRFTCKSDLDADARALAALLRPDAEDASNSSWQFGSSRGRYALLARTLQRLTTRRPAVVWLDDIHWGRDSLRWATFLAQRHPDLPVTILATARHLETASSGGTQRLYNDFVDHDRVRLLKLDTLPEDEQLDLVGNMLPLDDNLAEFVARRTEGNPLFATQLLGDWIERDRLKTDGGKLTLEDDDPSTLPKAIHELWKRRLEQVVDIAPSGRRADARRALELAATLGRSIDTDEWHAVCQDAGVTPPDGLEARLLKTGLADERPGGLHFAHSLLVDSLRRIAQEAGRLADHHLACARVLEARYDEQTRDPRVAERLADHLIEADALEEALGPLGDAVLQAFRIQDYREIKRLQKRRRQLIGLLDLPSDAPAVLQFRCDEAWQLRTEAKSDDSLALLEELEPLARNQGLDSLLGRIYHGRTWALIQLGEMERAAESAARWADICRQNDDRSNLARARYASAWADLSRGRADSAIQTFSTAADIAESADNPYFAGTARRMEAHALAQTGQLDEAEEMLEALLDDAQEAGARNMEANIANELGEIHRRREQWSTARRFYERFLRIRRQTGQRPDIETPAINLAMCDFADGELEAARHRFDELADYHGDTGRPDMFTLATFGQMGCAAARGNTAQTTELLDSCRQLLDEHEFRLPDMAWLATRIARAADDSLPTDLVDDIRAVAARLWRAIDREDRAEGIERPAVETSADT